MIRHRRPAQGFTLFELLVAIAIFAVISYVAYSGLRSMMESRAHLDTSSDRLGELQMAFMMISKDLQQAVQRPVRGEYGDERHALTGAEVGDIRLEFTRLGRRNPARTPRSNLQRVAYGVADQVLYRLTWSVLDRAQDTQATRSTLLTQVEKFEIRFLDGNNRWSNSWPTPEFANAVLIMPRALEIKLTTSDLGELNRFFILPEV